MNNYIEQGKIITPKLKVCGLCIIEQIKYLKKINIDFFGFIFYPQSPRYALKNINLDDIYKINILGENKGKVGVFVNEKLENIIEISKKSGLNYIQLHGNEEYENLEFVKNLKKKLSKLNVIKVFRIGEKEQIENLQKRISEMETVSDFILFDTDTQSYGGAGKCFDWKIIDNLNIKKPYFLSGGISIENISGIRKIKNIPFAIDINSKFENNPGNKNLEKIKKAQTLIGLKNQI